MIIEPEDEGRALWPVLVQYKSHTHVKADRMKFENSARRRIGPLEFKATKNENIGGHRYSSERDGKQSKEQHEMDF